MTGALSHDVERELGALARSWAAVEVLVLYGSAAKGRLTEGSDIDLYVRLDRTVANDRAQEAAFVRAASKLCRREIDLVVESPSTSVILRREVASTGRPLFERRPGAFRHLVVDAIRAYTDLEPQLRLVGNAIRARAVKEGAAAKARLQSGGSRGR